MRRAPDRVSRPRPWLLGPPRLILLLLLIHLLQPHTATAQQAASGSSTGSGAGSGGLAAGAAGASEAALPLVTPLLQPRSVPDQHARTLDAVLPQFQHPLSTAGQADKQAVAEQAHAEMRRWLQGYFNSSTSRLTSSRLQEARAAWRRSFSASPGGEQQLLQNASAQPPYFQLPAAPANQCNATCVRRAAEEALVRLEQGGKAMTLYWPQLAEDRQRWAAGAGGMPCLPRHPSEPRRRDFLVVAPVGNDLTNVNRWLDQPDSATFDLVLLHYGNATNISCPHCAAVLHVEGPKWMLLWQLTQLPAWRQLSAGRKALMAADDDVVMDTCTLNRVFEVFDAYGLLLAQPSLCPTAHRSTWYTHLIQKNSTVLRFVTMVEIMAPIFQMDFFQEFVRPSLWAAASGWGQDFAWPFLLHYPRDRIAVIDEVCMLHPTSPEGKGTGEGSIYAALAKVVPYDAREEEARRNAEFNYFPSEVRALGFPYRPLEVLGMVLRAGYNSTATAAASPPTAPTTTPQPQPARSKRRRWMMHCQLLLTLAAFWALMRWHKRHRRHGGSPSRQLPPLSPLPLALVEPAAKVSP